MDVGELAPGLWWWTARHPDWMPAQSWDPVVRCFCVETDHTTLVVDPLLPEGSGRIWDMLDRHLERRGRPFAVLLTQAAHARSAADVADRYGADVWGHDGARSKVGGSRFHRVVPGDDVPGGRALQFDQQEDGSGTPLYFPWHAAVAIGDVFISRPDGLHVWWGHGAADDAWYHERLVPSLRRWLELPIEHVLVAHGDLVPPEELRAALTRPPDRGE